MLAFFIGQFFTLFKKDPSFKAGVEEKQWLEKIKHIFDSLFTMNKELVHEAKEYFDNNALQKHLDEGANRVKTEVQALKLLLIGYQEAIKKWDTQIVVDDIQARFNHLLETAQLVKGRLDSEFDLDAKILELKKLFSSLRVKQSKKTV